MSGNQETRIRLPTWSCSDVPIKKRKYLVQPQLQPVEEAGPMVVETIPHHNEQGDTSVGVTALEPSHGDENQKITGGLSRTDTGEPKPLLPAVSVVSDVKVKSIGEEIFDKSRVKVEKISSSIQSSPLAAFEIPSSSDILGNSLGKLPVGAERPGVVVTDQTRVKVEKTVLKTHDTVKDSGETEASCGANTVSLQLASKTKISSLYCENEEPTALNLSPSKRVRTASNTDSISTCTVSSNSGVNRANWDLNTTMDAWEDPLDITTKVKTNSAFLNSDRSLHDIKTSNCCDPNAVIAKSVSEKQKVSVDSRSPKVTLMLFDNQVNPTPTCSLSLGLSSYPPIEKSLSLPSTTSEAKAACKSFSRPVMITGNVNSVNLKTVKSEIVEESVRQETESAQACPMGLSIKRVKQEAVDRFSQGNSPSSDILKPVVPKSIKPNTFPQPEAFGTKDGMLNNSHTPLIQSNEVPDVPTSSMPYIPCSNGRMTAIPGVQSYPDCTLENSDYSRSAANDKLCEVLKHGEVQTTYSCSGHGDDNLNALGVSDTSLTEEKILDDCKTGISKELTRNSCGTDEEKIILSGKEVEEQLYSYGQDPSRIVKNQFGISNLYDDEKVHGTDAVFTKCNQVAQAKCGGSETEQRDTNVLYHGDFQNSNHVEEKESQPALLGNTGENEGQIIQDGEGMSGISTVSSGIENTEIVDNIRPVLYKEEMTTIDNEPPTECSDGSQSRVINLAQVSNKSPVTGLDASDSFVPLQMERDRFSRERYHDKIVRNTRLNFMPDRSILPDDTENNLHDQNTKSFEFDNHGNTRRGGAFMSNFQRGRWHANEATSYSHSSFPRRTRGRGFSFNKGPTNNKDAYAFGGFRDGEKITRRFQSNNTEPMHQSRNGCFARGRTKFSNNSKRGTFPRFRSRSPVRSREQSDGSSSSFRNRSQEEYHRNTDFSRRKSPSGYKKERITSPEHSSYPREIDARRHASPPFSHRPSGRGRGYERGRGYGRGRGYARGRGYGRDGNSFRKPYDRSVHRSHENLSNLDHRQRVNFTDDFVEGSIHSERFGVDVNGERRRFGYRHDGANSFRPSSNNDGCSPTDIENDLDAVRFRQDSHIESEEQGCLMETDGENKNTTDNPCGRDKNMEEEETSKHNINWQQEELGGDDF